MANFLLATSLSDYLNLLESNLANFIIISLYFSWSTGRIKAPEDPKKRSNYMTNPDRAARKSMKILIYAIFIIFLFMWLFNIIDTYREANNLLEPGETLEDMFSDLTVIFTGLLLCFFAIGILIDNILRLKRYKAGIPQPQTEDGEPYGISQSNAKHFVILSLTFLCIQAIFLTIRLSII